MGTFPRGNIRFPIMQWGRTVQHGWFLEVACQKWASPARSWGFFHNQLNIIEAEGLFYDDFVLDWTRKHEKRDFEELVCQVNSYPCMRCFSVKLKIIGKLCFIIFPANGHFFAILWFLCIVWYVVATSSWIFTPNFETLCGFKGYILLDAMQC